MSRGTQVTPPAPHRKRPKRAPSHPLRSRRAEGAGTQPGSVGPERARLPKWERARAGLARRGVRGAPGTRGGRTHPESTAESEPGAPELLCAGRGRGARSGAKSRVAAGRRRTAARGRGGGEEEEEGEAARTCCAPGRLLLPPRHDAPPATATAAAAAAAAGLRRGREGRRARGGARRAGSQPPPRRAAARRMLLRPGSPRPPLSALRRDPRTCGGKKEGGRGRRGEGGARGEEEAEEEEVVKEEEEEDRAAGGMGSLTNRSRGPRKRGRGGTAALPPPAPSPDEVRGVRGRGAGRGGEGGQRGWEEERGSGPGRSCPGLRPRAGGHGIRGGRSAAAAARGSAVQSPARGAAGAAASATGKLKGKGDDRVTRPPAGAPRPRSRPRPRACLGPPPRPGRGCRPSAPAQCAHAGARRRPGPASPGALANPRPPGFPTRPRPLAAPPLPRPSRTLSTRCVLSPQLAPRAWARAPRGCQGPRAGAGALEGGGGRGPEWVGVALRPRATRAPPPGPAAATSPNFFFPGKLSRARPGGRCARGCLQVSSSAWEDRRPSTPTPPLAP